MRRWYLYVLHVVVHFMVSNGYNHCGRFSSSHLSPHSETFNQSTLMFVDTLSKWHAWNFHKSLCGFHSWITASALHFFSCDDRTNLNCMSSKPYRIRFVPLFELLVWDVCGGCSEMISMCKWFIDMTTKMFKSNIECYLDRIISISRKTCLTRNFGFSSLIKWFIGRRRNSNSIIKPKLISLRGSHLNWMKKMILMNCVTECFRCIFVCNLRSSVVEPRLSSHRLSHPRSGIMWDEQKKLPKCSTRTTRINVLLLYVIASHEYRFVANLSNKS